MPAVSIILPTCDRSQLLPRAVASVFAQTERDFELLIVDNNHREPPLAAQPAAQAWLLDRRVRFLRFTAANNAAAARNAGLAIATGEWVTFLDDDDAYHSEKIAAQFTCATQKQAPFVLCGARVYLRGRVRNRQTRVDRLTGDALLNDGIYSTPLLFHRRALSVRFDATLTAGEDGHYVQSLLAAAALEAVPVVADALVEIYQDQPERSRTNLQGEAGWRAARRIWWQFGPRYSPKARQLFVVRALATRAKLRGDIRRVAALVPALIRLGGVSQFRFGLNAFVVGAGIGRGHFVT